MSSLSGFVTTSVVVSEDGVELKENNLESNKVTEKDFENFPTETLAQQLERRKREIDAEREERNRNKPPAPLDEDDVEFIMEQERLKRIRLYNTAAEDLDEMMAFKVAKMSRIVKADGEAISNDASIREEKSNSNNVPEMGRTQSFFSSSSSFLQSSMTTSKSSSSETTSTAGTSVFFSKPKRKSEAEVPKASEEIPSNKRVKSSMSSSEQTYGKNETDDKPIQQTTKLTSLLAGYSDSEDDS